MTESKSLYIPLTILLCSGLGLNCTSQPSNKNPEKERLVLASKIVLPNVTGRIDHIAYDSADHLAFIAALGNNSVEVVNINTRQFIHAITGLDEPQGIVYISSLKKLVVANGGNGDCIFFDVGNYTQIGLVHLKNDADNIRYDETSHLLYVGYGSGGIAVIDANAMKQVANVSLDEHPESFQLSKKHDRMYINVPDANEIVVAELSTNSGIAKWKNTTVSSNFPMALDERDNLLFVGCRNPARLRMINTETGKDIFAVTCSGDVDDVFYDQLDALIFLSAGKGFIDVFRIGENKLVQINQIKTSTGARTSLLLLPEKKFLLAVPARAGNPAALWIYGLK